MIAKCRLPATNMAPALPFPHICLWSDAKKPCPCNHKIRQSEYESHKLKRSMRESDAWTLGRNSRYGLRCDHHGTMIHVVGDVKTVPALLTAKGPDMATMTHPVTGVKINPVVIERKSLTFDEAVTAHVMRIQGVKYNIIAQHLGTNTHRLGEVFREEKHEGSKAAAAALLSKLS